MKLAIEHVSCTIMETSIIQDISIHIKDGQFVVNLYRIFIPRTWKCFYCESC
jgi:hypothetical protein